jgi:acetyl-CoA synthetase
MSVQTLPSYEFFQSTFRIKDVEAELSGSLESGLNVCYECCDRHASSGKIALFWESQDGRSATYTFAELQALSARFANFLHEQGIRPGDIVAGLLPRTPELMVVALGTLRAGGVYQALFTAFGPKALEYRLERSSAKLIVTDAINRPKLDDLATLPTVVTVDAGNAKMVRPGELNFWDEVNRQPASFTPVLRTADDPFLLLFTSGTVGLAKGIAVPIKALLSFIVYMRYGIGLREDDSFWNVADPGWAYGLYYAVIGALLLGHATVLYDGPFTAESTYRILAKYGITNLAAAPSAYRVLMAAGDGRARQICGQLRVANSAGEPLNPEVIRWFEQHMGCSIYDQYGQTEHAMLVCNYHHLLPRLLLSDW